MQPTPDDLQFMNETTFRQLANGIPQSIWATDPGGNPTYFNQRWFDYTGLNLQQSQNSGWRRTLHAEDLGAVVKIWDRARATGESFQAKGRFLRAVDGAYRWHVIWGMPVRDPAGRIAFWLGTHTDVDDSERLLQESKEVSAGLATDARERNAQCRHSEAQFRRIVEGVKDYSILMLDPQGLITSWTSAATTIKGYSEAEILGRHFSCFYTPEEIACGHPDDVLRIAARTGGFEEQGCRVRKDGSQFWAEVLITPMYNDRGELQGFSKITRDISDRKEWQERLLHSEEKYRNLLESAPDAFVIADACGKIALVNAQTESLFGYRREELVGKLVETLIDSPLWRNDAIAAVLPPLAHPVDAMMELKGIRRDGSVFPIEVSRSPIPTPQGYWVAAVIRDITERKRVQRELIDAQRRSEEANLTKSDFLAAMSHEIRTPMNAILGMSDLLSETNLDEEQRQYVQVFRRAGANLLTLINNLLDLSKIETGHMELEQTEFALAEVVDQSLELVAGKAQEKEISLKGHLSPDLAANYVGDPTRLRQVLINLLGNAIKFTEAGEITLTVCAAPETAPEALEFVVADTGVGIPADKLETIFEEFKQADSSTTRKFGGTGLGLTISRRIVEHMGGRLSVTSELGKGSAFRFTVSLGAASERRDIAKQEVPDFHGRRVALIDNNATNRLILREALGNWGLQTSEFASSEDALRQLREVPPGETPFSLVIVDRRMPGIDGFAAARYIRADHPDLPVIMLTSDIRPSDESRRRESGLAGYAVRPVSRAHLLQLVCRAFQESPSDRAGRTEAEQEAFRRRHSRACKILVAEDSPDNRLLIQQYLRGSSHELTFAEHGREAVDQFNAKEFDVILMDLHMPIMDGLAATRTIRGIEASRGGGRVPRSVPIVALSANARSKDVSKSLEAGCSAHLSKPISKQRLLAALEEYTRPEPTLESNQESNRESQAPLDDGIQELVPAYLASRRLELSRLQELLAQGDFVGIRGIGHNLKGSGAPYGFPRLTEIGGAMQELADKRDAAASRLCIEELQGFLAGVGSTPT